MVLELLATFQKQIETMQSQYKTLEIRVNKELPNQLDAAFKEIRENFGLITRSMEAVAGRSTQPQLAAAAAPQGGSGFTGIFDNIGKAIGKALEGGGSGGSLTDMDKEILRTSKQIQLLTLKSAFKKVAESAGVPVVDHIIVE